MNNLPVFLMADDDDDDRMLARDAIVESAAQAGIAFVEDGIELLEYLESADPLPKLILLDLNMPRKDGRQALREIKSKAQWKELPIVILTTSSEQKDMEYARNAGAHSFITKPATFGEWIDIMKSLADEFLET